MQNSVLGASAMPTWKAQNNCPIISKNAKPHSDNATKNQRRNQPACEMCYRKKIKCEVESPNTSCIYCMRHNIICKFVARKERGDNLQRIRYVKSLEERLKQTESLLRASGLFNEDYLNCENISDDDNDSDGNDEDEDGDEQFLGDDGTDIGDEKDNGRRYWKPETTSSHQSTQLDPFSIPKTASQAQKNARASLDSNTSPKSSGLKRSLFDNNGPQSIALAGRKTDPRDQYPYFGRSSPLSILTREGIEWIKNKSGEAKFMEILISNSKFDSPWDYWRPDVFHDVFSSRVFKPLPPRAEVFSLLRDYFQTVNRLFPLYHEATFMELVEWQYTQQICDDSARWASINIILSLAYEYRFSNTQKSDKDREKAWLYYKNAMSVFAELSLRRTDLLSVQALLGMALFLRGNSNTRSTLPIITAAIRSSHRIGLHRDTPRSNLTEAEQEQRKRVFWIAYILDQSTCMRVGNAPAQHFDDFDIGFPSRNPNDDDLIVGKKPFFSQLCHISLIKSRIYNQLYSATALEHKTPAEICELIKRLDVELDAWKKGNQFDTFLKQKGMGEDFLSGFASAGLCLVYYNSLIMIHRLPLILNSVYQSRLDRGDRLHPDTDLMLKQSSASAAICVQAARDTLKLVNNLPWGDIAWIWSLLHYVFLAVMTIFVNLLRNSQQPTAKDDLQSLNMASTFFATLVPCDGPSNYATFMAKMATSFERLARAVFERDQKVVRPVNDSNSKAPKVSKSRKPSSETDIEDILHPPHHYVEHGIAESNGYRAPPTPPNHSTSISVDIPDLDGLPPINSSGYVVRESPGNTPRRESSSLRSPGLKLESAPKIGQQQRPHPPLPSEFDPINQLEACSDDNNYYNNNNNNNNSSTRNNNRDLSCPNSYSPENMIYPFSTQNFPQPELWQIPMAADWEFSGQFLGDMFGQPDSGNDHHGQNYFFPTITEPPMVSTVPITAAGIAGTPMGLGYRYGTQSNNFVQGSDSSPNNQPNASWMDGHYTNPY